MTYRKFGPWVLLIVGLLLPLIFVSANNAFLSNQNRVVEWLPKGLEETRRFLSFVDQFGSDEILLVSWPGCTLGSNPMSPGESTPLQRFTKALRRPVPTNEHQEPLFGQVYTGPDVLATLMAAPLQLDRDTAIQRMSGWLVGKDSDTTGVLALVSEAGQADRAAAIEWVYRCAESECGVARDDLRLAGSTLDGVAIDQISTESISRLNPIAWCLGFLLAWLVLGRSFRLAIVVFGVAQICSASIMAVIYWTGTHVDAVLLMVSTLVFVLTCSGAVHTINYMQEAAGAQSDSSSIERAIRTAWPPGALSALTTIVGVGSLVVSQILPIQRFGLFASLGVALSVVGVFVVVPACLALWRGTPSSSSMSKLNHARLHQYWLAWADFVIARYRLIVVICVLLSVVSVLGTARLGTTVNLHSLLGPETKVRQDYRWIQERIGPMVPMELVIRFADKSPQSMSKRLAVVEKIAAELRLRQHVGATISAGTFLPEPSQGGSVRSTVERTVYNRQLIANRDKLIASRYLREYGDHELWRISVRVAAIESLDYGAFLQDLEREQAPHLASLKASLPGGFHTEFCGSVPLISQTQHQLLTDLYWSFGSATALVAIVMIVVLRSVTAGLLSMLPNVLPALAVFGAMGFLGIDIEIGSMMTASVALGIAVDDTLHFVFWFRRQSSLGLNRTAAVRSAFRNCGTAMCQTTFICGLVFLVFATSSFLPTARFAWVFSSMMFAALAADLLLLPAILVSPLGRFFEQSPAIETLLLPGNERIEATHVSQPAGDLGC
jgi:uncharacterized protein